MVVEVEVDLVGEFGWAFVAMMAGLEAVRDARASDWVTKLHESDFNRERDGRSDEWRNSPKPSKNSTSNRYYTPHNTRARPSTPSHWAPHNPYSEKTNSPGSADYCG